MVSRPVAELGLGGEAWSFLSGGTEVLCARVKHTGVLSLSRGGREERRVTWKSGLRRLPRNRSYRQGGHSTEQRCGIGERTATVDT